MDWGKAVRLRTAVRDDCARMFRKPVTAEATSQFQSSCVDQQNEELDDLAEEWEQWRTDLIEDWDRQQTRFLHGCCHALSSLQRALYDNTAARLHREAKFVFVLGELITAWESNIAWFSEQDCNRHIIGLHNKAKRSLAMLIEELKREGGKGVLESAPHHPRTL
ncbi:hypothetical protein B0H11DRAFT_2063368 [Mycena galericulata]|nr:hypothetical protein B0H11DRAFT_2063368 [Mycena galericulata]